MQLHQMQADHLLCSQEVAEELRVSMATVQRWAREGMLPAVRPAGTRTLRFRPEDVNNFLASGSQSQCED